jgi:hypothetical protein
MPQIMKTQRVASMPGYMFDYLCVGGKGGSRSLADVGSHKLPSVPVQNTYTVPLLGLITANGADPNGPMPRLNGPTHFAPSQ